MIELWSSLDPQAQFAIAGVLAGAVLWLIQKYWTDCPVLGWLGPDSSTARKRLTAVILAAVSAAVAGQGDWQQTVAVFLAVFTASQTAHTLTRQHTTEEVDNE
jgi:hypothetical protein